MVTGGTPVRGSKLTASLPGPLKDRKVLAAVGIGGAAGGLILLKRRSAGGAATGTAGTTVASPYSGVLGGSAGGSGVDTSITDLFQQQQDALSNTLGQYQNQYTDVLTQLASLQQSIGNTSTTTPNPTGTVRYTKPSGETPTQILPPTPAPSSTPTVHGTFTVAAGQNWNTIAAATGLTLDQLRSTQPNATLGALGVGQTVKY